MVNFGDFFENLKLAVKQCYQTGQFVKDRNWWKMPKFKNSNTIFFNDFPTIFTQFELR